jgi:hypothetical protein
MPQADNTQINQIDCAQSIDNLKGHMEELTFDE